MERKPNCQFCSQGSSDEFSLFFREKYGVPPLHCLPIAETDNFLVNPDILPVNPDGRHFLVFPKIHRFNFASFGGNPPIVNELGSLIYQLEQKFGPLAIFEHGGIEEGGNNQSIYHAHFHAVGGLEGFDIISWMADMVSGGLSIDEVYPYKIYPAPNYDFLTNLHHRFNNHPYLYAEQGPRAIYIEDKDGNMRSQVTQRSLHLFFSKKILDWKKIFENDDYAKEAVRRLANIYDLCYHGIYNAHQF